jgi:hypothetical protein
LRGKEVKGAEIMPAMMKIETANRVPTELNALN